MVFLIAIQYITYLVRIGLPLEINIFEYFKVNLLFRCKNRKGCVNYYKDAVGSSGCFFNFLSLTSALCCALDVKPLDESTEDEKSEELNYYPHTR